ncbi:RHS repeat protein [Streptococcus suis]|nr:RHS repeat protein [Streptococcus suis]NQR00840.1 RHS repeat protein [Streptococcus suis]
MDGKESKTEFSYDAENRLLEMKSGDKTITYTYDKNGNRTSSGAGDAKLDYIYDTEGLHILFSPFTTLYLEKGKFQIALQTFIIRP